MGRQRHVHGRLVMPRVVFLHGLNSGPTGSKFRELATRFDDVTSPDCRGLHDPAARLAVAEQATRRMTNPILVGSSFGGLVAALLASHHPARVGVLVLLAPALHARWTDAVAGIMRVPSATTIIHGVRDCVVPVQASRAFATRFSVDLIEVDDDHRLGAHRELIGEVVQAAAGRCVR